MEIFSHFIISIFLPIKKGLAHRQAPFYLYPSHLFPKISAKSLFVSLFLILNGWIHQGNTFSLESLDQNKATLLYFWGTWCGYCRYTSPAINSLAKEGYQVVSVALRSGNEAEVNNYLSKNDYHFTTVNDPKGELAKQWQINVTPTIVLLSKGKMDLVTTGLTSYWGLKVRLFFAEFFG